MLTDMEVRALKPAQKIYKVSDQQGLYLAVTPAGTISFRYDYRIHGRRETLAIGKYDPTLGARKTRDIETLGFGCEVTLAEARLLLARARRAVQQGESPSRAKTEKRREDAEALSFGAWAQKYFAEADIADSTRAMRKSVYDRNLAAEFGRLRLEEITPTRLMTRCERIKERGVAAPAVHAREIVLLVFRFVQARGIAIDNPAEAIRPSAIAKFKVRDRALSPKEIQVFFNALEDVAKPPGIDTGAIFCRCCGTPATQNLENNELRAYSLAFSFAGASLSGTARTHSYAAAGAASKPRPRVKKSTIPSMTSLDVMASFRDQRRRAIIVGKNVRMLAA